MTEKTHILTPATETITNVKFDETLGSSQYVRPIRMHFERKNRSVFWDLALEHDSVSVVLYHKDKKQLLFVKQFRPPVFVRRVQRLPENVGKSLGAIDWAHYPIAIGETLELCAGLMDKPTLSPLETVHEEILEECGYRVPLDRIHPIKSFVYGVSLSGATQHMFYAEVDESMKETEGGGNETEGEFIKKVFLTIDEVKNLVHEEHVNSPPALLYGINWFLDNRLPLLTKAA
ncbi:UDP-sugar diphosphatase [Aphelenchoides avenae]|nr:UDP-sugar diphosphatase [Aphelenchus avenae]